MRKRTSTPERPETPLTRRDFLAAAASVPLGRPRERVADEPRSVTIPPAEPTPFVVAKQGSFMVGGTVVTNLGTFDPILLTPDGQTIHGDHAYVQYQIPPDARSLPLVL